MDIEKFPEEHQKMIDSHGGYDAVSKRIMVQKVYFSLYLRAKNNEESVSFGSSDNIIRDYKYDADIYTETGITKLKIPPRSCFELKNRLVSDTVFRVSRFAYVYRQKYPNAKVYLIYQDKGMLTEQVEREVKKQKIVEVCQLDDFLKKVERVAQINSQLDLIESEWKAERALTIDTARFAFRENHCTFFLGAGVSRDAGGPSWNELLQRIIRHFKKVGKKADFDKVYDACGKSPIILGRYVAPNSRTLQAISEYLQRYVLYRNVHPEKSELIKAICEAVENPVKANRLVLSGEVDSIITYNYDDLVETALESRGVEVARIYQKNRYTRNEFPVYHVHGLIPQKKKDIVSTPILGEKEYHEIYKEAYSWSNVEQLHALDRNVCFFIGLSMTDPNLRRLLDISGSESDHDSRHFAFLKRESLFKEEEMDKNKKHFSTIENQMADLGVQVIWYERYDEVPDMLRQITAPLCLV